MKKTDYRKVMEKKKQTCQRKKNLKTTTNKKTSKCTDTGPCAEPKSKLNSKMP